MDGFCFCQRILPPRWLYQVPQTGSCSWHPLSWCTDTIFKMTTFVFEIYENLQWNPLSLCLYFVVTWRVLNLKRFSENCFGIISQWTGFMWSGNLAGPPQIQYWHIRARSQSLGLCQWVQLWSSASVHHGRHWGVYDSVSTRSKYECCL